ncbi:hypothetical protein ACWDRB_47785 [Nonomuraea sp. NPDC003707]
MYDWKPYIPETNWRVVEASCCEAFRLCHKDAAFFVLRRGVRGDEETGRGTYAHAVGVWQSLAAGHQHQAAIGLRQFRGLRFRWSGGVVSVCILERHLPQTPSVNLRPKGSPSPAVFRWPFRERVA